MDEPIIDLHSEAHFMGEALRQAAACFGGGRNLCCATVKQPFINVEDKAAIQEGIDRAVDIVSRLSKKPISGWTI